MAGGIFEVEAAPVIVDAILLHMSGVSPICESTLCYPGEDGIELLFGNEEGVVVMLRNASIVVVETDAVGGLNAQEWPERLWWIEPKDLSKKGGGRCLVPNRNDGVVELNCHGTSQVASGIHYRTDEAGSAC